MIFCWTDNLFHSCQPCEDCLVVLESVVPLELDTSREQETSVGRLRGGFSQKPEVALQLDMLHAALLLAPCPCDRSSVRCVEQNLMSCSLQKKSTVVNMLE